MKSANRDKLLVEGAKKEGKVVFYTGLIVDQVVRPVKDAFEKEYPFVQVDFFRANAERLAQRMLAEYQAKSTTSIWSAAAPRRRSCSARAYAALLLAADLAEYPPELKDPKGFWGSTNVYFMTLGYNTRRSKPPSCRKATKTCSTRAGKAR